MAHPSKTVFQPPVQFYFKMFSISAKIKKRGRGTGRGGREGGKKEKEENEQQQ
jgi:hypothetical protein